MKTIKITAPVIMMIFLLAGCNGNGERAEQDSALLDAEGIHIEGAWARPGSEGRMSAAYFLVTNFDETADTLLSVNSEAAQLTEIHESYQLEDGMAGMREVGTLEIPAQSTVRFEQGGLHVMLIQLTKPLREGESFTLILQFARHGKIEAEIPVKL